MLAMCFSYLPAAAAENEEECERECSLTVDYEDEDDPISGAAFDIYLAGEVTEDGEIIISPEFAAAGVSLQDESDSDLSDCAVTLETYILEMENEGRAIEPVAEGVTGEDGILTFSGLDEGLYLLVGETFTDEEAEKEYIPLASIITLPYSEDEEVNHDPVVIPKFQVKPAVTDEKDLITVTVKKVWEDSGYEDVRPESINAVLFCNGEEYDTVTLSDENDWQYAWKNLDADSRWQLTEENVPENYTMTSVQNNYEFTVTNTIKTDNPPDSSTPDSSIPDTPGTSSTPTTTSTPNTTTTQDQGVPNTGQNWWTISVLSFVGLILLVLGRSAGNKTDKH
jgi:hypothetical protein